MLNSDQTEAPLIAPGFEEVGEVFNRNFTEFRDRGAAFTAIVDGQTVVDVWGGERAPGQPWQRDTTAMLMSGSKGVTTVCMLMLVDRGLIRLDDPVARYWPEFAAAGKASVRIEEVVSHRGRLPGLLTPMTHLEMADDRRMARLLAEQPQDLDPRAIACYHALTFGWICGELVRRVTSRSLGAFFSEEVAGPLGLDLWLGLPGREESRVADIEYGSDWNDNPIFETGVIDADPLLKTALGNPFLFPEREEVPWNDPVLRRAEIPAANAIGTARSVARLYACLANGGELDGVRLIGADSVELGRRELSRFFDHVYRAPLRYGAGFNLTTPEYDCYGPVSDAFGHPGAGGSTHGAWPRHRTGFSYVMNELRAEVDGSRAGRLLDALHRCVRREP